MPYFQVALLVRICPEELRNALVFTVSYQSSWENVQEEKMEIVFSFVI